MKELAIVVLVVVVAILCSMIVMMIFDGLRPAKLLLKDDDGRIIEVDEK